MQTCLQLTTCLCLRLVPLNHRNPQYLLNTVQIPTSFRAQQHLLSAVFVNPGAPRADPKENTNHLALGTWPALGFFHLRDDDGDLQLPFLGTLARPSTDNPG